MVEKPWNKNKSRIKIHQTRDKKDNALRSTVELSENVGPLLIHENVRIL